MFKVLLILCICGISGSLYASPLLQKTIVEVRDDIKSIKDSAEKLIQIDKYINWIVRGKMTNITPEAADEIYLLRTQVCRETPATCFKALSWARASCEEKVNTTLLWRSHVSLLKSTEDVKLFSAALLECSNEELTVRVSTEVLREFPGESTSPGGKTRAVFLNSILESRYRRSPLNAYFFYTRISDEVFSARPASSDVLASLFDAVVSLPDPQKNLFANAPAGSVEVLRGFLTLLVFQMNLLGKSDEFVKFVDTHGSAFSLQNPDVLAFFLNPLCDINNFKGKPAACAELIKSSSGKIKEDGPNGTTLSLTKGAHAIAEGRYKDAEAIFTSVGKKSPADGRWSRLALAHVYRHYPAPGNLDTALTHLAGFKSSWNGKQPDTTIWLNACLEIEILLRKGKLKEARAKTASLQKFLSENFRGNFSQNIWTDYFDLVGAVMEGNRGEIQKLQARVSAAAKKVSYYSVLEKLSDVMVAAESGVAVDQQLTGLEQQMGRFHPDLLSLKSFVQVLQNSKKVPR